MFLSALLSQYPARLTRCCPESCKCSLAERSSSRGSPDIISHIKVWVVWLAESDSPARVVTQVDISCSADSGPIMIKGKRTSPTEKGVQMGPVIYFNFMQHVHDLAAARTRRGTHHPDQKARWSGLHVEVPMSLRGSQSPSTILSLNPPV